MTIEEANVQAASILEVCTYDEPLEEWKGWAECRNKLQDAFANALTGLEKQTVLRCIALVQDAMGTADHAGIRRIRRDFTLNGCLAPTPETHSCKF